MPHTLSITDARERLRAFWASYDLSTEGAPEESPMWEALFRQHIPYRSKVADLGAGTGYCSMLLAQMGYSVMALDWSEKRLAQVHDKAQAAGQRRLLTQIADVERMPINEESFDAVVARQVLWTLLRPQEALAEWRRVLKPGGAAIVDFHPAKPCAAYDQALLEMLPMRGVESSEQLLEMFRASGFSRAVQAESHALVGAGEEQVVVMAWR